MKKLLILFVISIFPVQAFCQLVKNYAPWTVIKDGSELQFPYLGGFNNPKPLLLDINNDGLTDLLVGEEQGNLIYFQNTGTSSSPQWSLITERFAGLDIGTWFTFTDIDNDNDQDLFCDSRTAKVLYYRNDSNGSEFLFTLVDTAFGDIAAGNNNRPAFCDIDDDGDYDFFYGAITGYLEFYKNIGNATTPDLVFTDAAYDSIYAYPRKSNTINNENHGFSNIAFADIDNDNDFDLFWGDIFNLNMYCFINYGDSLNSDLTWLTQDYLPQPTLGFNHSTFADLDNDTDLDMIIGVAYYSDIDNFQFYRNNGNAASALFNRESLNYISNIDVGSYSVPEFGDLDADRDLDMLIGNANGQLTYYENVGSRYSPSFQFVTDNYKAIDVGGSAIPCLVDYDLDGDLDLLIGNQSGKIQYWQNIGNRFDFQPVLIDDQVAGIKRDQLATPQMIDLNNDGLKDLVVGEWDYNSKANVFIYRNIGTQFSPIFVFNDSLLNVDFSEFTIPYFYDWDNDGRKDLIVGNNYSGLSVYKNNASPNVFPSPATLTLLSDTIPGSYDGWRITPKFVDINFDGDDDLFFGETNGGVNFYENQGSCCQGIRGNIDNSSDQQVDIADVVYLIDYMFILNDAIPACEQEVDVDGNDYLDIGDLVYLVQYVLGSPAGPPPVLCE